MQNDSRTEDSDGEANGLHDRQVAAVTEAVAKLLPALAPAGFTPEAIFEGALRGGAVAIIASGATVEDVAELLDAGAAAFRRLEKPKLRLVGGATSTPEFNSQAPTGSPLATPGAVEKRSEKVGPLSGTPGAAGSAPIQELAGGMPGAAVTVTHNAGALPNLLKLSERSVQ